MREIQRTITGFDDFVRDYTTVSGPDTMGANAYEDMLMEADLDRFEAWGSIVVKLEQDESGDGKLHEFLFNILPDEESGAVTIAYQQHYSS